MVSRRSLSVQVYMPGKSCEGRVSEFAHGGTVMAVMADTNIRSPLQRIADCQLQIVVVAALNERYDIYSLEDVQHHAVFVQNRHT